MHFISHSSFSSNSESSCFIPETLLILFYIMKCNVIILSKYGLVIKNWSYLNKAKQITSCLQLVDLFLFLKVYLITTDAFLLHVLSTCRVINTEHVIPTIKSETVLISSIGFNSDSSQYWFINRHCYPEHGKIGLCQWKGLNCARVSRSTFHPSVPVFAA